MSEHMNNSNVGNIYYRLTFGPEFLLLCPLDFTTDFAFFNQFGRKRRKADDELTEWRTFFSYEELRHSIFLFIALAQLLAAKPPFAPGTPGLHRCGA
jgi:hypothetical protein